ncbi:hypothetical protein [Amantichitinum ursilacus]|uniref:Uncharacterized protein n=1 Tax=Amantichitinum ursilacus TaxID=857265 RepID=A0A0N0XL52_9NEIS|nr:hypothetical protein [Amantichitinum ursilacus]KPC54799.1 hypothetical protein WG78_04480 [Amantichitinum ursilacus]
MQLQIQPFAGIKPATLTAEDCAVGSASGVVFELSSQKRLERKQLCVQLRNYIGLSAIRVG